MMQYFDIYHLKSSVQNYKPDSMKKTWIKEIILNSFRSLHLSNGPASTMAVQYLSHRFTEILRIKVYHLLKFGHQARKTKPLLLRLPFKKGI